MSQISEMESITFKIDGVEVQGMPGQTILEAAEEAGIYIPRLCQMKGITPHGSCRVCTVKIGGKWFAAACTQPIAAGPTHCQGLEKPLVSERLFRKSQGGEFFAARLDHRTAAAQVDLGVVGVGRGAAGGRSWSRHRGPSPSSPNPTAVARRSDATTSARAENTRISCKITITPLKSV